jgi:serine protease AprX
MKKMFILSHPYSNCRKIALALTIVFSISLVTISHSVNAQFYVSQNITIGDKTSCYEGYIIEFNEEPISTFKCRFKDKIEGFFSYLTEKIADNILAQKVSDHKNNLLSLHRNAKEDILKLFDKSCDSEDIFSREFIDLFNGIAIKNIPDKTLEKIRDLPYVKSVSPDYTIVATLQDSIPIIRADEVWSLSDGDGKFVTGKDVTIAILDTGVDYNHPDLEDNFVGGYDFYNNDNDPMDDYGHGTHVAGIAVGVAPDVELYAYKVLDNKGEGRASDLIKGIEQAVSDNVDIISISAGDTYGNPNDMLSIVADNAVDLGIVVVAAVGNDGYKGEGTVSSPASARKVIGVGATDKNDEILPDSSRGPNSIKTVKPDIVAPGGGIVSTWPGGGYQSRSGTSMACPHVSGTVALMLQIHPDWNPDEVKMALRNTAVDIGYSLTVQGYGRIDALEAVTLSETPPIAILTTSDRIERGIVDIYGTASADDLQNYCLYYKQHKDWIKLYEGNEEINDNVLGSWDTRLLNGGTYELKLEVNSINQTSIDIVYVTLEHKEDELIIEAPDGIDEFKRFTVKIKDADGSSKMAWVLFTTPYHRPMLRYGSLVTFRAPLIINPQVENLEGKIIVFKILGGYKTSGKQITVDNK